MNMGYPEYEAVHFEFREKLLKQFLCAGYLPSPPLAEKKILINLQNGTMEFSSSGCKLREFDSHDFLTYQLPFSYDKGAACSLFNTYLKRVLPEQESRMALQEFSGFIFTELKLEKCLVLLGPGHNGKSVFFDIIVGLLSFENVLTYSLGQFKTEYNRARLTNVLLNYSSEKNIDLHPDTFKALVSGEPVQAREPYGKSFTIRNKVKFMINANEMPSETEQTDAYFRRYLIIPFEQKITDKEKDIHLAEKIVASELPGVFNWILEGLNRLLKQEKFTESPKAKCALNTFREESDSVEQFLKEFKYCPSENGKISLAELYLKYKHFCQDELVRPVGKKKFAARFEKKGFTRARLNNGSAAFFAEENLAKNDDQN